MQSPIDSTTSPSTMPDPTSTETPAPASILTLAPESTLTSAQALAPTPTIPSTPESVASTPDSTVPSSLTPTIPSSLTPNTTSPSPLTPNLTSPSSSAQTPVSSSWASAWASAVSPDMLSATTAPAATLNGSAATPTGLQPSIWAGFSSQMDPQQLRFHIGPSTSTGASPPAPAPAFSWPVTPSSNFTIKGPGLFGSDIVTEVSKAPVFKFESRAPAAARKQAGQSREAGASVSKTNVPKFTSLPGTSSQSQRTPFPNLGPDVVIRPVSSSSIRNPPTAPKQNPHPGLQDSEVFQLLAGYKYLKEEVASLKVQLANGQALMQEILNNFSSEVARINIRLSALERGRIGQGREGQRRTEQGQRRMEQGHRRAEVDERETRQGREHGQGREGQEKSEHEQRRIEEEQRRMAQGQRRMEHAQGEGRIAEEIGNNIENDGQEGISEALGNMTLAKEKSNK